MSVFKNSFQYILLIFMGVSLSACKGSKDAADVFKLDKGSKVNINLISVVPSNKFLYVGESNLFSATGGASPYTFSIDSGIGSITKEGLYIAPSFSGAAVVKVTDVNGKEAFATISVAVPLNLSPTSKVINQGDTVAYGVSGGIPPYSYRIATGVGTIDSSTGVYDSSGVSSGSAVIEARDSADNSAFASVNINSALLLSPTNTTIGFSEQINFNATGGDSPYTYSIISGGGAIDSSTGVFVGPNAVQTTIVRATDSSGNSMDSIVNIADEPQLDRPQAKLAQNASMTFTTTNGAPPYTYSIASGGGTIDSSTGLYTAPSSTGAVVIQVADANGLIDSESFEVFRPRIVAAGHYHNCFIDFTSESASSAKCWGRINIGYGQRGQSGADKELMIGDEPDEILDYSKPITFPEGTVPRDIFVGRLHNCIVTDDYRLLCWGHNGNAVQGLGHGDSTAYAADNAGENLVFNQLGSGRTLHQSLPFKQIIDDYEYSQCFILDDNSLRCYGRNYYGMLGYGNGNTYGDSPSEVGDSQAVVNLGADGATSVGVGYWHVCVSLTNGKVKCWGRSNAGQTGMGSTATTGHNSSTTPDNLPYVDLGTGRVATKLCTGFQYNCALLDGGDVKCWGENGSGQLGVGDGSHRGASASHMGDNLQAVDFGAGLSATDIACADHSTCAILNNNQIKCWGDNAYGQLGVGHTTDRGNNPIHMGDNLEYVDLGAGRSAVDINGGYYNFCAELDNGEYKCWGYNNYATMNKGHRYDIGVSALSMGDNNQPIKVSDTKSISKLKVGYVSGCAILDDNTTTCWGLRHTGNLGQGGIMTGDALGEIAAQPNFDLASQPMFKDIQASDRTTCALNFDNKLTCWGAGDYGITLQGTSDGRGSDPNLWGDNITYLDFGPVNTVKKFKMGINYTGCAILTNDELKCWGANSNGMLGIGSGNNIGDHASEVGNVPSVDLGSVSYPIDVDPGYNHTCALLANGGVKCWGINRYGSLGIGNTTQMGDNAGEMGDALPFVNLGAGVSAKQVCAGNEYSCALTNTDQVKCWGKNGRLGTANGQHMGNQAADMGDNLPFIDFGANRSVKKIACQYDHACALLDNDTLKCWGHNANGKLGYGIIESSTIGDNPNELGDNRPPVNVGDERKVIDMYLGYDHTCAILDNNDIKCWGLNSNAQLGVGHRFAIGTSPTQMGDFLLPVEVE